MHVRACMNPAISLDDIWDVRFIFRLPVCANPDHKIIQKYSTATYYAKKQKEMRAMHENWKAEINSKRTVLSHYIAKYNYDG